MSDADLLHAAGLVRRRLRVAAPDMVWLRSILEGYDGLAAWYADGSGVLTVSTTVSQASELDALLAELCAETPSLTLL